MNTLKFRINKLLIFVFISHLFLFITYATAQNWECGTKGRDASLRMAFFRAAFTTLPDTITTTHFIVKYDRDDTNLWGSETDGPNNADAFARAVSNAAETSYTTLIPYFDPPPDSSNNHQIEVGVSNFNGNWSGLADSEAGDAYVLEDISGIPIEEDLIFYINVPQGMRNADGSPNVSSINEVTSHEFFHCVHGAYDWHFDFKIPAEAEKWSDSTRWFEESTCDWASELVFDDDNNFILDHVNSFMTSLDKSQINSGFPYRWFMYYEFLSTHLKNGGDGRWIIRRLMQEFDNDEPQTLEAALDTHSDVLKIYAVEDGVDNDLNGTIDDASEGALFSWDQSFVSDRESLINKNSSSPDQLTSNSYFARAVYLKDYEYEEGTNYPAPLLYDGTLNPIVIDSPSDLPNTSPANQSINTWGIDYIKYEIKAVSNLDMVEVKFEGADDRSMYVVKTLRMFGDNIEDKNLELDTQNKGAISVFAPLQGNTKMDYDLVVIVTRINTAGNGQYSVSLEEKTTTPNGIDSFPYKEGFESGIGVWMQDSSDNLDWTINSNSTPSSSTGPSSAVEGSFYAYVEASGNEIGHPDKSAILTSPSINLSTENAARLNFDYHMYGLNMGSLKVEASKDGSSWTTLWTKSGNQGNTWHNASVDISVYTGSTITIRFVGTTGNSYKSDIAIDKLTISTDVSNCTAVTLNLTFDNFPRETSWSITDNTGNTLASGVDYSDSQAGSTITEVNCLSSGCYKFNINDTYGDGICCGYGNGLYTLTDVSGNELASGGTFGASEEKSFCVGTE